MQLTPIGYLVITCVSEVVYVNIVGIRIPKQYKNDLHLNYYFTGYNRKNWQM